MGSLGSQPEPLYSRIYAVVRQIPEGKVASYGQISKVVGAAQRGMVGYAMSALKGSKGMDDVPWQRVVNSRGTVSVFGDGWGNTMQVQLLREEGIQFSESGRIERHEDWWLERPF